jgi:putative ABC transport system permease protein
MNDRSSKAMMNRMIVGNLVHRPVRSLISIVAVALEVTLILLIVGLCLGMLRDNRSRNAGIGADVIVLPPGSSFISGLTGAPMPVKIGEVLAKLPHVTGVAPVVTAISSAGTLEIIAGIDLHSYESLSGGFHFLEGGPFQRPYDVLVDDLFAQSNHAKVGDTIEILNNKFRISGIVERGKGARKFIPLATLQDLVGAKDKASIFYLKLDDPANADLVVDEIKHVPGMEHYVATSMASYLAMMTTSNYPGLSTFIDVVVGISVVIGFIVIFQAMYTAVMERTREIGILKAMGASKPYIVNVVLRETALLAIAGIVLGIVVSLAARAALAHKFPLLQVVVDGGWMVRATLIAMVGAMGGALYPAFKAAQKDPIDALAYE